MCFSTIRDMGADTCRRLLVGLLTVCVNSLHPSLAKLYPDMWIVMTMCARQLSPGTFSPCSVVFMASLIVLRSCRLQLTVMKKVLTVAAGVLQSVLGPAGDVLFRLFSISSSPSPSLCSLC